MTRPSIRRRAAALALATVVGPAAVLAGTDAASTAQPGGETARDAGKNLVLRPGAIGKANVGMTVKQALHTGLFRRAEVCGPLRPKGKLDRQMGATFHKKRIIVMEVGGKNIRTAKGAGIGTTLEELRSAYGKRLSKPRRTKTADPRWAVYLRHHNRYLGFLIGGRPRQHVHPWNKVVYLEVTRGERPYLYPDGC